MDKKNFSNHHTPMIQQYLLLKSNYPDIFLFYRLGDFYELFFEDAKRISILLNITLTKRGYSLGKVVPMAGIPCNSLNYYLIKLLKQGESVALCEQTGTIDKNTGLIERKVIKVITPGTVIDEFLLSETKNSLLGSIYHDKNKFGYATLDLCSGEFFVSEHKQLDNLLSELKCTDPEELLLPDDFKNIESIKNRKGIRYRSMYDFSLNSAYRNLNYQFNSTHLKVFGIDKHYLAIRAAGGLLQYLKSIQYSLLPHVKSIRIRYDSDFIFMNSATRKHLEVTINNSGTQDYTLFSVLDHTATAMGSRLLKQWLNFPIRNIDIIQKRQKKIKFLKNIYSILFPLLKQVGDLERVVSRIALLSASPNDFLLMKRALFQFSKINSILNSSKVICLKNMCVKIGEFNKIKQLLVNAIKDYPSINIKDGNVIADNYNVELDKWRKVQQNSKNYFCALELRERKQLAIESLKIGYNKILGYFIQINKKYVKRLPSYYKRISTLKNCERYSIPELIDYEKTIIHAKEKVLEIEKYLYNQLFKFIEPFLGSLSISIATLSELDVLSNLAERACVLNYTCPVISKDTEIILKDSRHPVIETILKSSFIPNSLDISHSNNVRMLLITGPNMGGKSTYMRQIALIIIMTWIGSFVPASYAKIGPCDKIFTRIGSADNLTNGESTFMMEMTEMSSILHDATSTSIVLVDELGRGTAVYDGLSIAWACIEYLIKEIKSITLFSTHYFQLTKLEKLYSNIKNVYFDAIECNNKICFMYSIKNGSTNKSYSLAVALLANLPVSIIKSANKKLQQLSKLENKLKIF